MRMLSGLLGVAVLSSMAVYFEGRFYALLPDYSNLFHICKELGNGGSTIILAYGIVLGTVGLGLLMPTILHREPKERVVSAYQRSGPVILARFFVGDPDDLRMLP